MIMNARDFIRHPFTTCPKCGAEKEFGGLMVVGDSHIRRCRSCWHTQSFPLPPLNVSVLYLDQNILSNMLRILDPSTGTSKLERMEKQKHFSFFNEVFRKIHRLTKLQLLVCPESPIHYEESIASGTDFKKLKRLYKLLSRGVRFFSSNEIRNMQLCQRAAHDLSNHDNPAISLSINNVTHGDINAWQNYLQITLSQSTIDGLEESLRADKGKKYDGFAKVWERWQSEKRRTYDEWYREERLALSQILKEKCAAVFKRKLETQFGLRQIELQDILPDANEQLLFELLKILGSDKRDLAEFKKVWSFLESDTLDMVPHVRISSRMFAALAGRASRLQKLPTRALFNDIDVISAYLPYCDAMFLDKEMGILLTEGPLRKFLGFNTRIFSIAKKDEFLAFLDSIETNASSDHLEKVREVYGDSWEDPFVELFHPKTDLSGKETHSQGIEPLHILDNTPPFTL
jgi:hypothetical protein